MEELRAVAVETNAMLADELKINRSTAITCVKPSGTVSQLTDSASVSMHDTASITSVQCVATRKTRSHAL